MPTNSGNDNFAELRQLAEKIISQRDYNPDLLPENFTELVHELEVHQIELEMQYAELQQTYEILENTRQKLANLFDFAPVGYIVTDQDGLIYNANLTAATMLGLEREALLGQKLSTFFDMPSKDTYYLHRRRVFKDRTPQSDEMEMQGANAQTFFAQLNSTLVEGEPTRCRTAITNINKLKQAEEATRNALARERELNRVKARLIEVISHDLNTPLSTLLSSLEVLAQYGDRLDQEKKEQRFASMRNAIWYLNDIVEGVVTAHQSGKEDIPLKTSTFDLLPFIRQIIEDLNILHGQNRILYEQHYCDDTCEVTWDQNLFRRILTNLVENALRYSQADVVCSLACKEDEIVLRVQDQGTGIPDKDQPHIFEMFYRGDNTESISGTGIGLSVVKRAVEAHNGTIDFETGERGTIFTVRMPLTI